MSRAAVQHYADPLFDTPPLFVVAERRMAGQALDRWQGGSGACVPGFETHSLSITDPSGAAIVEYIGTTVAAVCGIAIGMRLGSSTGFAGKMLAACRLAALQSRPQTFEASVAGRAGLAILLRGIALPIGIESGRPAARVQLIVNWREVLDRTATARLRRELGSALHLSLPKSPEIDPFSLKVVS